MRHNRTNFFLYLIKFFIALAFFPFLVYSVDFSKFHQIGILNNFALPSWQEIIISLLVFDLIVGYFFNWLNHQFFFFWKIHQVHHTDNKLNASTSFRNHPFEQPFRFLLIIFCICFLGSSIDLLILYLIVNNFFFFFSHSNIKLNDSINKIFTYFFVTPNYHKVHHHFIQPQNFSNLGCIFSFWDRFFNTYLDYENYKIKFGLIEQMSNDDENFGIQLHLPFKTKK